jgi:hypothetical protein
MRDVGRVVAAAALALSFAACHRAGPSATECEQMLDRYLDMTIGDDPTLAALPTAQAQMARAMKKETKKGDKSYHRVADQCLREVSRTEYECAMKANGANQWEACIE